MKVQLNDIRAKSTWEGKEPRNHSPGLDYCRKLLAEGVDPEEPLEIYRGEMLAYTIKSIGEGSKWGILENEKDGPRMKKYRENTFLKANQRCAVETADAFK